MKFYGTTALLLLLTASCATKAPSRNYQKLSEESVGCSSSDISITDLSDFSTYSSWVAACHGKKYHCTDQYASAGPDIIRCTGLEY